jgi:hypothetical protein
MSDIDNDDAKEVLAVERAKLESLMSFVPMIVIKRFLAVKLLNLFVLLAVSVLRR